jgi:glyoxylase-like metal-dependent hydrolase (beta-lactamase superfamily II)
MPSPDDAAPPVDEVRPGIWAVPVRMPEQLPYSLCYLIADDRGAIHVIDPGWDSDENAAAFEGVLAGIGASMADVASITVTHLHGDHLGAAGRLADASGAPVLMHRVEADALAGIRGGSDTLAPEQLTAWQVPDERRAELTDASHRHRLPELRDPDRLLEDGDMLPIPGRTVVAIWTPGHTPGHLSFEIADQGILFTGDHVLPTIFSGIGLGGPSADNPIADYLVSLGRVAIYDDHLVLPGHEHPFRDLADRTEQLAAHHLRRSREVQARLDARGDHSVWGIASQLTWTAGWENLTGFMLLSALRQTEMHVDFVRSETARTFL